MLIGRWFHKIQYRPELIDACLATTGLTITTSRTTTSVTDCLWHRPNLTCTVTELSLILRGGGRRCSGPVHGAH